MQLWEITDSKLSLPGGRRATDSNGRHSVLMSPEWFTVRSYKLVMELLTERGWLNTFDLLC